MKQNETMKVFIDRVLAMKEKCATLGENISECELKHTVY